MKQQRIIYLAGYLDASSSIQLKQVKNANGNIITQAWVSVTSTREHVTRRLEEDFGGSVCPIKPKKAHYLWQWKWVVASLKAYDVCKLLRPYMEDKADVVQSIIDHYEKVDDKPKIIRPGQQGSGNGLAKLTETKVKAILKSPLSNKELAALYGVDKTLIAQVRRRVIWKHVT